MRSSGPTWAAEPPVELVPVHGGARWERLLAGLGAAALVLAVLKPWSWGAEGSAVVSPQPSAGRDGAVVAPVALSMTALHPAASACFEEMGWHVCLVGTAAGQGIRSWFGTANAPGAAPEQGANPAALLVTQSGAGLAFFAPASGTKSMSGAVWLTAWRIADRSSGALFMPLRPVAPARAVGPAGSAAPSRPGVFVPSSDDLRSATRWPAGSYAFLLQSSGGSDHEEYFGIEISAVATTPWAISASPNGPHPLRHRAFGVVPL